jgi:hypothetical protein
MSSKKTLTFRRRFLRFVMPVKHGFYEKTALDIPEAVL